MSEFYIVFNKETGTPMWRGQCPTGEAKRQVTDGLDVIVVPVSVMTGEEISITAIQDYICSLIDNSADAFCQQFLTPGATQTMRYELKYQEALKYTENKDSPTPMLLAEANALGITLDELAAKVIFNREKFNMLVSIVEPNRIKFKQDVKNTVNLNEMLEITKMSWKTICEEAVARDQTNAE